MEVKPQLENRPSRAPRLGWTQQGPVLLSASSAWPALPRQNVQTDLQQSGVDTFKSVNEQHFSLAWELPGCSVPVLAMLGTFRSPGVSSPDTEHSRCAYILLMP